MTAAVTAFAPASIGNLGVGFDMLGLALEGVGDRVTAALADDPGVGIAEVRAPGGEIHTQLPADADANTASIAASAFWDAHGDGRGLSLIVHKGVPLKSGMGSSAASAVAAVVAVNALLPQPLPAAALLPFALEGEKFASQGLHADNVAPSLFGGLVLCPQALLPRTMSLPVPKGVSAVLLHPELEVSTAESRRRLAASYPMAQWLDQQAYLAAFIAACASSDIDMIRASLKDVIIEPQRAASVPGFADVKTAALDAGALGCSLSGSGPSIFCLVESAHAAAVAAAMEQACRGKG
ncbi:MAG: homoserine kinase, partial [Woeseiaceae bacterium]|nr:homoserine kinase [Woeseiaceae bacterium]